MRFKKFRYKQIFAIFFSLFEVTDLIFKKTIIKAQRVIIKILESELDSFLQVIQDLMRLKTFLAYMGNTHL